MAAKYIISALAVIFLASGATMSVRGGGVRSQGRTWLLTGMIFAIVSAYLWFTL